MEVFKGGSPVTDTVVETEEWPVAAAVLKGNPVTPPVSGLHPLLPSVLKLGGVREAVPRRCVLRFWFGGTDFFLK